MKNSRKLVLLDDAQIVGRVESDEHTLAQNIEMPSSGETSVNVPGKKCSHGVYIPANTQHDNRAEYCTLCFPYDILAREGAVYAA